MTPELAAFSDWTLALLPRLFLYPGGLWLLVAILALRFASSGAKSVSLRAMLSDLGRANLLSISVAWACVAVMPFPGAPALPAPVDALVLASLPVLSLLLDMDACTPVRTLAAGAITLAIMLPAVEGDTLLTSPGASTILLAFSSLAVIAGLFALCLVGHAGIASEVRWLAWFCLGVVPLWQRVAGDSPWAASLFVFAGVVALNGVARLPMLSQPRARRAGAGDRGRLNQPAGLAVASAWLLALPALLWALLAAS